jgi:Ca-activated chloride channel family protein
MRFLTYYFFIFANLIIANDKGMDLFNNGNYKEAAEYYSSILKERGEDNAASFNLGASQYYMEDNVSALKRFEQALGSKDRMLQSKALYNMARILQDQNELDKSLSLYKKSLELNPKDIDSKINYELLKKMINQQNTQDQENDQNQEGSEEQQNDQNQEGSEEQQNDQNQEGSEGQQNNQNQEGSEEQKQNSSNSKTEDVLEPEKSDQIRQAEAILNAIKGQEKINQKNKILKSKSFKLDKDW